MKILNKWQDAEFAVSACSLAIAHRRSLQNLSKQIFPGDPEYADQLVLIAWHHGTIGDQDGNKPGLATVGPLAAQLFFSRPRSLLRCSRCSMTAVCSRKVR